MNYTLSDIEHGKESKFWKAVTTKLEEFLADIHTSMEDPENEFGDFKSLSGSALAIRRMMVIPDVLMLDFEKELENKQEG